MATSQKGYSARWGRRISQLLFLALFLVLFRLTDYRGKDEIGGAVNLFFRWDPLVAAAVTLAGRTFISLILPSLAVVGLTLVFGRAFCGWLCPLGTLIDASARVIKPQARGPAGKRSAYKYYLLILVLFSAALGAPLVGYLDPFSILVRGLTIAVDPTLNAATAAPFDFIYKSPTFDFLAPVSEPLYKFLQHTVLPYQQKVYAFALPSLAALLVVFALERIERRFWCRDLCPLGALLGVIAKPALLRQHPGGSCGDKKCGLCKNVCRMGAIGDDNLISVEACNLCLDCAAVCPKQLIGFRFTRPKRKPTPLDISRRGFAGAALAGLSLPLFMKARDLDKTPKPFLLRPPGALAEKDFLGRCVRCGECMKVCITNALHPAAGQAGLEGLWSPVLVPRVGYCEYNCSLCGQVCPTGAIQQLALPEKQKVRMGRAVFDKNRCLPWAKGKPCVVCEEMCPIPDKAIRTRHVTVLNQSNEEVEVQQPYVVDALCTGCGRCEQACPLSGNAAVRVIAEAESRDPESADFELNVVY
jgi:MauM/NapG family ferredoxin protein